MRRGCRTRRARERVAGRSLCTRARTRLAAAATAPTTLPRSGWAPLRPCSGYLDDTHRAGLEHLRLPEVHGSGERLQLDQATRRNLELLATMRGERRGSLLWVLDQTLTPMGGRLLRQWLLTPLTDIAAIGARLDAVEHLRERHSLAARAGSSSCAASVISNVSTAALPPDVSRRATSLGLAATLERIGRLKRCARRCAGCCTAPLRRRPRPDAGRRGAHRRDARRRSAAERRTPAA